MKRIVINKDIFGYRAAIIENDRVMEIFIEREGEGERNGNIYLGKVANVIPGMDSSFVNIGLEKNGFLYIDNLREFEEKYPEGKVGHGLEEFLKVGDEVMVQAITEPNGSKGVRLTTNYTLPGKYMVLLPNNDRIAISKKIKDEEERNRLEEIIKEIKPDGVGVILRTQGIGKSVYHFEREMAYLLNKWKNILKKKKNSKVGTIVYKDNDLLTKISRDIFCSEIDEFVINDEESYWEILSYINTFGDVNNTKRIKLYNDEQDIFDFYKVTPVIESSLEKIVWLECGGYLVIQTTEALTSIDVNTGKNIGGFGLEKTTYITNIEAAKEIPRQLMLRNLGGIIIIDFIDMKDEENKILLLEELENNLKTDRIKNSIVHFTDLSLIEMTRKRVGNPLSHYFYEECPMCKGKGKIKSKEALIEDILKDLRETCKDKDFSKIRLIVSDDLYKKIQSEYIEFIIAYIEKYGKKLELLKFKEIYLDKWYEIILIK
ncbi:MAG: Rne/Rng family ribonuclease [Fusobacteriaceae bacterium]